MLQQHQNSITEQLDTKPLYKTYDDDEEEEEESINYKKRPQQKKRSRYRSTTSTPEPTSTTTSTKKTRDPNRKDKIGRTKIFQATTAGHLDKVMELVEQGADVNFKDNANWTPLHEAANNGRFEIAQYLIQCGAEINVRGYGLDTPLHDACQSGNAQCVQLLVDAGADVFALNEKNQRPIDLCTSERCKALVTKKMKKLDGVMKRDSTGKTLLHDACLKDQCDRVRDLIRIGADVNAQDNQKATPLHLACAKGYLNVVKLLLEQGALVHQIGTEMGETPLHQASRYGHEAVVRYLIDHAEANVNLENKAGKNAYRVAASHPPTIRQMLTARMDELRFEKEACNALDDTARKLALQAEPERQLTREERKIQSYMKVFAKLENSGGSGGSGETSATSGFDDMIPLPSPTRRKRKTSSRKSASVERDLSAPTSPTATSKKSSAGIVKLDPFKKDTSGGTQLHKYASRGDSEAVLQLLESGARPDETDYAGWTALHEAALKGHIEVVKILLKYGADANVKGGDLDTPLHDATENNHCDIVELLLEHGADPFARNINNAEPIDIAMHHEFEDIILVLQSANPVKKKRRTKVKVNTEEDGLMTDVYPTKSSSTTGGKKRRLVQAANSSDDDDGDDTEPSPPQPQKSTRLRKLRQRTSSPDIVPVKVEHEDEKEQQSLGKENHLDHKMTTRNNNSNNNRYYHSLNTDMIAAPKVIDNNQIYHYQHSPIHTPPPEQWNTTANNKTQQVRSYCPIYFIRQPPDQQSYVVDLQVALFLGFSDLNEFWESYADSFLNTKKLIHAEMKAKLWPTMAAILNKEGKSKFMSKPLHFIALQDVLSLLELEFHHLLDNLLTIHLDVGCTEDQSTPPVVKKKLPPKIAMKLKKCGYKFPA